MNLLAIFFLALAFNIIHYSSAASDSASETPSSPPMKLPDGYEVTAKTDSMIMAVKLMKDKASWNEARKGCFHEGHGAFLAYPSTKEEEKKYLEIMNKNKINDLWIGIHDLFENNFEFSTIHGEVAKEAASYTWFPGEPNKNRDDEPCTEYRKAHGKKGLNDRKCHLKYEYLCKITMPVTGK